MEIVDEIKVKRISFDWRSDEKEFNIFLIS